ncbi:MAG TPA: twin-arginine translocation signal domain-containing protein, partial [Planctomycetota bacterium]|nr:twin-arginine translocation signal domain-containing protein [Planctomycetota bacterium]
MQSPQDSTRSEGEWSRRRFLRTVGGVAGAAVTAGSGVLLPAGSLHAATQAAAGAKESKAKSAETWVKALYETLTSEQKKIMHFPFDHEKRSYVA